MAIAIVNASPLALGFVAGRVERTGFHLTAIVKGAFKLVHGGRATWSDKPLLSGDVYRDDDPNGTCTYDSDFAPFKPKTDVSITGTCHAPRGIAQGAGRVAVRVGAMRKALAVYGDRHFVERKLGGWDITEPKPFRSLELRYEHAYGGPGYEANPLGKGYAPRSGAAGRILPNVELPSRLLKSPEERVEPAGLGPLNRRWGLRTGKMGSYDEAWLADRWPDYPHDFDWTYFNAVAPDQQTDWLDGDEPIVIEGMHPDLAKLESRLPAVRPRCFTRKTGEPPAEVVLRLDTVAIDMDAETLTLVWRGLVPVWSREYAEIEGALLVAESFDDAPRPASEYAADAYWKPAGPTVDELAAAAEAEARGNTGKAAPPPPPKTDEPSAEELAEVEQARKELLEAGAEQALLDRIQGVRRMAVLSQILNAYLEEKLTDDARAKLAADQADPAGAPPPTAAAERRREKARAKKEELDAMRAELKAKGASEALLQKLAPVTTRADFLAILVSEMPAASAPDEAAQRKALVDATAEIEAREEAADAAEEAAERSRRGERLTRDEVVAMLAAKASLAEANLTELDLSGLDFSSANLTSAVLAGAKLDKTRFVGADLTGASLRMADLRGAVLDDAVATGADLEGTKLAGATASRAHFHGAKLGSASLEGAQLDEADFTGAGLAYANLAKANIEGALFDGANLERASLRGASGTKATFRGAKLASADLVGAKLDASIFIGATLDGAEATRASLRRAHLDECSGKEASFAEASLTGLRAQDASLPKARFTKISAEGARFAGSQLGGADFGGAHLVEADFSGASLVDASFNLARLEQANFTKAKLVGARLTQANVFRGRLGGADLTDADCRSSNFFECELFEANATRTRFDRANLKRTCLDRGSR